MKKSLVNFSIVILIVLFCAVFSVQAQYEPTGRVVVYNAGSEAQMAVLADLWAAKYPDCDLEFISAGSGELTAKIEAEGENPQGDIIMGGSYSIYNNLTDYLEPYTSPNMADCLPSYSGVSDYYTPIQINVNTIIVNNELIKEIDVTVDGWQSLVDPALKGKISYVDPSASSSAREQVINMLAAFAAVNGDSDLLPKKCTKRNVSRIK